MLITSSALICIVVLAALFVYFGAEVAIYGSLVLFSIAPTWVASLIGDGRLDTRFVCFGLVVLLRLSLWQRYPLGRVCFADFCLLLLAVEVLFSKMQAIPFGPAMIFSVLTIWILPYAFGRLVSTLPHARQGVVVAATVSVVFLTALLLFESVVGINPINSILGRVGSINSEEGRRWGLRRAEGPSQHPISMGMIIAALLPWVLDGWSQVRKGTFPWRIQPWLANLLLMAPLVATLCCLSRGPMLVVMGTCFLLWVVRLSRLPRAAFAMVLVAGFITTVAYAQPITSYLERLAQDEKHARVIAIKGVHHHYTGTSHRLLLFPVYQDAMASAGWLGFGRFDLADPKYAKYVEPHLHQMFWSVDNQYVFSILNEGYLGLALFALLMLTVLYYCVSLSDRNREVYTAAIAAWLCSLAVVYMTVFSSSDFHFYVLFNLGFVAGCYARRENNVASFPAHAVGAVPMHFGVQASRQPLAAQRRAGRASLKNANDTPSLTSRKMPANRSNELTQHAVRQPSPFPSQAPAAVRSSSTPPKGIDARLIGKYLVLGILGAALGGSVAYFVAPKLETVSWMYKSRLNFRVGRLNVDSYQQPDIYTIMPDAFSKSVISDAVGHHLGPAVHSALEVQFGMGKSFVDLQFKWPDQQEGEELLGKVMDAGIDYSKAFRAERLEESQTDIAQEIKEVRNELARVENEQLQFRLANQVNDVAAELTLIQQEIRALEVQLLDVHAHRKGIDAMAVQRELQGKQTELLGAGPEDYIEGLAKQRELQRELALIQTDRARTKARLQYENQLKEVERKRALHAKKLLTDAELQRAELGLKLLAVDIDDTDDGTNVADKLDEVQAKLTLRETLNTDRFSTMVGEEIASRERIAALEARLSRNRAEEPRLRDLLPREEALSEKREALEVRLTELQKQVALCASFARSNINELYVVQDVVPADPATKSDLVKLSMALFIGSFGAFIFPFAVVDGLRIRRKRNIEELTNIGLGRLSLMQASNRLNLEDHSGEMNAPSADVRRMINQLFAVMPDDDYVLLFASLQNEPPSMALMFDVARCFSRRGRNVMLVIVDPAIVDPVTGENKPRFRDHQYASQLPDRFEIEHVDAAKEVVADLDRHRRNFDLIIVAAGFDTSDSQDLDLLTFYADGVVFTDVGTGKHFEKRVNVVRQLNDCEGNVLGMIS